MKVFILDSGILINLSMNGLLDILEKLKEKFDGKFIITEAVKAETIDRPLNIPKFELGALRVQDLINKGVIEYPESLGITKEEIKKATSELMSIANHFLKTKEQWIEIVSEAEISCLALSDILERKKIENIIGIDERTTRILCEYPESLVQIMSEKLHQRIIIAAKDLHVLSRYKFIRSSELVFVAYKKGILAIENKKLLEALLYATKFKGTAISFEEINELKKL